MARAVAAPRPEPPPVMRTATSFNCMVGLSLGVWFFRMRMANSEWRIVKIHSLLAIRYSPVQHSAADQRFHVLDVLAADFVSDRTDAGGARHRVAAEKQVIAGADQ